MISSEYSFFPFLATFLTFALSALVLIIGIAVFIKWPRRVSRLTSDHLRFLGVALFFPVCLLTIALAFAAGFWALNTPLAAVLAGIMWLCVTPNAIALTGPNRGLFLTNQVGLRIVEDSSEPEDFPEVELQPDSKNNKSILQSVVAAPGLHFSDPGFSVEDQHLRTRKASHPGANGSFRRFSNTENEPTQGEPNDKSRASEIVCEAPVAKNLPAAPLPRALAALKHDVQERASVHAAGLVFCFGLAALTFVSTHNMCICNKPQSTSSWLSRMSGSSPTRDYCPDNGVPCFTYVMVGASCDNLMLVSHYRLPRNLPVPARVYAEVCPHPQGCPVGHAPSMHLGTVRDNSQLQEDQRYIAHVPLLNLTCGQAYAANVVFVSTATTRATQHRSVGKPICFHTLPLVTKTSSPSTESAFPTTELSMIFGGDYVPGAGVGQRLLALAVKRAPNASLAYIGGDVGYENNVRTCYSRLDQTIHELLTELRRPSDQCLIPLLTAIGNHDAGGYQWFGPLLTSQEREAAIAFYLKYWPTLSFEPLSKDDVLTQQDSTLTYHTHNIGELFGFIILDTGHMFSIPSQVPYLKKQLEFFRSRNQTCIVSYHVPAYPSSREMTDVYSAQVRANFAPLLENDFDDHVTMVVENHDHNYKRTVRIRNSEPVNDTVLKLAAEEAKIHGRRLKGRGILYTGDGALGASASDRPPVLGKPLGQVVREGNYVSVVFMASNGSALVVSFAEDESKVDEFVAP